MYTKSLYLILVLCSVQRCYSTPIDYEVTEGRGIGSTLWGWITYPFSWWSSDATAQPVTEQLVASTTLGPYDNIEVGKRNVTVWCNDQTCTTMKCDRNGCRNNTCNIYDTDMTGECREYNNEVKPEEPLPSKPTEATVTIAVSEHNTTVSSTTSVKPTEVTSEATTTIVKAVDQDHQGIEEKLLELEAVLSSSVVEDKDKEESE